MFLLISSLSTLNAQEAGIKILNKRKVAEIPFKNINNLIIIQVVINETIPLQFILDSGVRTPLLTEKVYSDILNISYAKKLTLHGAGKLQQVDAYLAYDVSLSMQDVLAKGQSMLVLEEDYLELGKQLGTDVHGILGFDIFNRFVVKIDYQQGIISLYEPKEFRPDPGFSKFSLLVEDAKPYLEAEVKELPSGEKKAVKLLLDTGAGHALLLHQDDSSSRFQLPEKTIYGNLGRGLVGDIMGNIGRIHRLSLGNFTFKEVLTSFPDNASYGNISEWKNDRGGTFGGDLLSRFTVIFDYSRGHFYLKKNSSYSDPFIYSKTGMVLIAGGKDLRTYRVVQVREGSPASEAGIQEGDELVKVGLIKAKYYRLPQLLQKFRKRDGKKIRLKMKRGEKEYETRIRLRNII